MDDPLTTLYNALLKEVLRFCLKVRPSSRARREWLLVVVEQLAGIRQVRHRYTTIHTEKVYQDYTY